MSDKRSRRAGGSRRFFSPVFIATVVVLLAAAIGLNSGSARLKDFFLKEPMPIRKPLEEFDDSRLASFSRKPEKLSVFVSTGGDVETEEVITRTYELKDSDAGSAAERDVLLFITYYADPEYLVSHTPEVCYRQAGSVISSMKTIELDTPGLAPEHPTVKARLLDIDQGTNGAAVLYTLCCNGDFFYEREQVRWKLGFPGDKYIYIAKVEAVTVVPPDSDFADAEERLKLMLTEALPILMDEHFPSSAATRGE